MRTLSKYIPQQYILIIITTVPNLFFPRGLNVYFLKFFADQSSVAHSIQLCLNINLFQTDLNVHCVQSLTLLKNMYTVQSHVFQFYQVASPWDVTAPSKTKVNFATPLCKCVENQLQKMKWTMGLSVLIKTSNKQTWMHVTSTYWKIILINDKHYNL